ncbi:DinB family protein [Pleomorphovibrio marinus]|uniref:DinB family protein n=1 Tax=Pleomorphovibrio marinus TaxID=2164132 RepID=UPI000E0C9FEB|nr:DinB family protein [Pleomorphovibrio marinus]
MNEKNDQVANHAPVLISPNQMLEHWQGHRALTRRVIEAFPEDKLFSFSLGGMRSFGDMAQELLAMAEPSAKGFATGEWEELDEASLKEKSKDKLLEAWDRHTAGINKWFPQIPVEHFQQVIKAFNTYEGEVYSSLLYMIDNEIHHRGQGYVYLRVLGITPPNFWER